GPDARQGRAAGIEKYDPPSLAPVEARPDLAYVQRHRTQGATTQRDDPLFRALAEDPGHAVLVQHILEREPYQLGDARPGRVHELAQLDAGHALGVVSALPRRIVDEAPHIAHVVAHRVRAGPSFEGEIVPELLQPERPLQLARRHNHRRTRVR